VLWPAASAIASRLLTSSGQLGGKRILEVGAGTGLVSIAAAQGGAAHVLATDYEEIPLQLLQHAAAHLNNNSARVETAHFDLCDATTPLPRCDVLVAADVMYDPATGRAAAARAVEALRAGGRVLIGDSPGRAGRPAFLQKLRELGVHAEFQDVAGWTVTGQRHELICGKESTTVTETPQAVTVAIMELDPTKHLPS
jgi:predicted nicotinamide N-methyase